MWTPIIIIVLVCLLFAAVLHFIGRLYDDRLNGSVDFDFDFTGFEDDED